MFSCIRLLHNNVPKLHLQQNLEPIIENKCHAACFEFLINMVGSKFIYKLLVTKFRNMNSIVMPLNSNMPHWMLCFSHYLDLLWLEYLILGVWALFFISESKNSVACQIRRPYILYRL